MVNERLKKIRADNGLTQVELARKLGISQPMLSQVEQGDRDFSDKLKVKIAGFFGVSVEWLFFEHLYCNMK